VPGVAGLTIDGRHSAASRPDDVASVSVIARDRRRLMHHSRYTCFIWRSSTAPGIPYFADNSPYAIAGPGLTVSVSAF